MAGETTLTIIGNITDDPTLRFTPAGAAVANFTVASTPRFFDKQANEWRDGDALFMRCSIWRQAAENVAESLTKGARVIVTGRLQQRSFETREGDERTVIELQVDEVGPSLKYATAKVNRLQRGSNAQAGGVRPNRRQRGPLGPYRLIGRLRRQCVVRGSSVLSARCEICSVEGGHELWCSSGPGSVTMGELRENLTAAIDLAEVHESKSVGLLVKPGEPARPVKVLGVQFYRGQFVFMLQEATK